MFTAFTAASAGISIIGDMFGASEARKQTEQQVRQLELQKKQDQLVFEQRHIKRLDNLKTTVNSNIALAGFRGISPASGSFKAIEQKSFGDFNEDENMDSLNLKLKEQYADVQEEAARQEGQAQEVAPFFKTAADIFSSL